MFKRISMALAIVLVLSLASGAWVSAAAEKAEVPFKAYYPVNGDATPIPLRPCVSQVFTPGGDGLASQMGVSLFEGNATSCFVPTITQKGVGTLTAANGDSIFVDYTGAGEYIDAIHIVTDGTFDVTGGTGRFEGVTGSGMYHVYVYMDKSQPNDLWFEGHLHNP
jgi:hypothetical protein